MPPSPDSKPNGGDSGSSPSRPAPFVDLAKVSQLLDAGWTVELFRNELGTYTASGIPKDPARLHALRERRVGFQKRRADGTWEPLLLNEQQTELLFGEWDEDQLHTDDFSPEAALTRLAYKAFGEIV